MSVVFRDPMWLWLVAGAVPIAYFGWRWLRAMTPWRRASALVLRTVLLALIGLMLAGAQATRPTDRLAVVGVVDVSGSARRFASTAEPHTEIARRFFAVAGADRGPDDLLGLVVFDGRATTVVAPTTADASTRSLDVRLQDGTDLAGALRYASSMVPPDAGGRLVLVSDGNETTGDALAAAAELNQPRTGSDRGLPVDVVPLEYDVRDETLVERVDVPGRAPAEATVSVRVVFRSASGSTGTLRLSRAGEAVDLDPAGPGTGRRVRIPPGRSVQVVEVPLPAGRVHAFEAVYEPDLVEGLGGREQGAVGDTALDNNTSEAFTITPGRGAVLVIESASDASSSAAFRDTLTEAGIDVQLATGAGAPRDLLGLQAFDLVVLHDVPADEVPLPTQRAIAAFVQQTGGGLIMTGGPNSFGAGGWKGSDIEDLLPVRLDLPEELVVPPAAVVFVMDRSGSMGARVMGSARSQQQIANDAAALAVLSLDERDEVGVISFSSGATVVRELSANADAQATADAVRAIASGGGTNLPPALEEAGRQLSASDATVKHIIVMSDGRSQGAERLPEIADRLRLQGIRVTTIAVGDSSDNETLEQVAVRGDGAFYSVVNPQVLPRIFLRAVRVVRSPLVREQPFLPDITDPTSTMLAGTDDPPRLWGLVLTQPREDPRAITSISTSEGEPVLAHWASELGQVVAFTSDTSRWAREWRDWEGFDPFWLHIVRNASRPDTNPNADLRVTANPDGLSVRVSARNDDGAPLDLLSIPVTVYGPAGEPTDHTLTQVAPGEYTAQIPTTGAGNHVVVARPRLGDRPLTPLLGGTSVRAGAEYRSLRSDRAVLEQIAERTGGRVLAVDQPLVADLFDRSDLEPTRARMPLWPPLLVASLVVFLLDVGTRRVAWDRLIADARQSGSTRTSAAANSLESLADIRERVADRSGAAAMDDRDAERIVRQQHERRLRRQSLGSDNKPKKNAEQAARKPAKAKIERADKPSEESSDSGLLAAKKRARDRFS